MLNRELVNTLFSFDISISFNLAIYNNINIDIEIDTLRDWLNSSSTNSSRKLSVYSSISFIPYAERIEALNNGLF